jgi:hypothetical protein
MLDFARDVGMCSAASRIVPGNKMKILPIAFLALIISSEAHAQLRSVPEGVGVADRARPDYLPIGGRLGSFFLYPTLSITAVATDNVLATDTGPEGDVYGILRGEALLRSNFSRHSLRLKAYADQSVHSKFSSEDVTQFGGQLDGLIEVTRRTQLIVRGIAERQAEERTSYNNISSARSPVRYGHYLASFAVSQDLAPLALTAGISYERFSFRDAVDFSGTLLSQRYRNYGQLTGTASATYTVYPGLAVLVRGSADRRSYSLPAASPLQPGNQDRDSSGGRIEAGLQVAFTSLLYGEARVGYLTRNYSDLTFRDTSGLSFGADLLWNVTPLTTLKFGADRSVQEASSTTTAGNRITQFDLSADHELLRNLIVSAAGSYARIAPLGPLPQSSSYGGRLEARYLMSRQVSFRAGYMYAKRTSPSPDNRFQENRGTATAILTF